MRQQSRLKKFNLTQTAAVLKCANILDDINDNMKICDLLINMLKICKINTSTQILSNLALFIKILVKV